MYYAEQNLKMTENRKHYGAMYDSSHILVKMDRTMDWMLVYQYIKPLYPSQIGRPTIPPFRSPVHGLRCAHCRGAEQLFFYFPLNTFNHFF